jgi:transposase
MLSIHQDLVEHRGFDGSYDAIKRFVRSIAPRTEPFVVCRYESPMGEEAQVDYGEGAPTRHPQSGNYLKPRLFVMTLGASRKSFEKVIWKSSQEAWCQLHEDAFAHFGGAVKLVRLDGLKEGAIKPDIYDPELNPLYADVMAYYGVIAVPCRPYTPRLKGKVERTIDYVQDSALKGRRFECIEDQNVFLQHWDERVASTRIHGTTKRQVRKAFEEERPLLLPLPPRRFEYYKVLERRVHFDGHIEVAGAYYSVPTRYVGTTVVVHQGQIWLRILDLTSRQCVREHEIAPKGSRRTADEDRPKQTPPKVLGLVARAALIGPASGAFARALEAEQGALCMRTLFGLLDLAYRYGNEAVERACTLAATARTLRFRFLRTYLAAHAKPKPLAERHKIIPGIETYSKHFKELTRGEYDDQR